MRKRNSSWSAEKIRRVIEPHSDCLKLNKNNKENLWKPTDFVGRSSPWSIQTISVGCVSKIPSAPLRSKERNVAVFRGKCSGRGRCGMYWKHEVESHSCYQVFCEAKSSNSEIAAVFEFLLSWKISGLYFYNFSDQNGHHALFIFAAGIPDSWFIVLIFLTYQKVVLSVWNHRI